MQTKCIPLPPFSLRFIFVQGAAMSTQILCSAMVFALQVEQVLASFKSIVVPAHPLLFNHTVNTTILLHIALINTNHSNGAPRNIIWTRVLLDGGETEYSFPFFSIHSLPNFKYLQQGSLHVPNLAQLMLLSNGMNRSHQIVLVTIRNSRSSPYIQVRTWPV